LSRHRKELRGVLKNCEVLGHGLCVNPSLDQGRTKGGRGQNSLVTESLRGEPKSPNNVTSIFFIRVRLLPKEMRFDHGAPNLLIAPGAI